MNFDIRKNILKYDDVMEAQRDTIYTLRDSILSEENPKEKVWEMIDNVVADQIYDIIPEKGPRQTEDLEQFSKWLTTTFNIDSNFNTPLTEISADDLHEQIIAELEIAYKKREEEMGSEMMRLLERLLLLDRIDSHWKDHLYNIDFIEQEIRLAGYGGKDPIVVFKSEALGIFESMYQTIEREVSEFVFKSRVNTEAPRRAPNKQAARSRQSTPDRASKYDNKTSAEFASQEAMGTMPKVGRNAPCPCGSGKKYKKCHGG